MLQHNPFCCESVNLTLLQRVTFEVKQKENGKKAGGYDKISLKFFLWLHWFYEVTGK
jgi:hypothetical protein